MAAEPPAMTCRVCHRPIRLVAPGVYGHETPYRVGMLHPRHLPKPERVKA